MVELRKRPAPKETATPAPTAKRSASKPRPTASAGTGKVKKAATKVKDAVVPAGKDEESAEAGVTETDGADAGKESVAAEEKKGEETEAETTTETPTAAPTASSSEEATTPLGEDSIGKSIKSLDGFGGTVKTHAGVDVTFKQLLEKSEKGVVVFTYPKASTPGCTTQACAFRDSYSPLRDAGLAVYGLSTDSPKANTTFATKQNLQYELLCDPDAGLTGALGLKKGVGKGTLRGSVLVTKDGKVQVWTQAGPAKTLESVVAWVDEKK